MNDAKEKIPVIRRNVIMFQINSFMNINVLISMVVPLMILKFKENERLFHQNLNR